MDTADTTSSLSCAGESSAHTLDTPGLHEDDVWQRIRPALRLEESSEAKRIAQHAFTKMLNKGINHSRGEHVTVRTCRTDDGPPPRSSTSNYAYSNKPVLHRPIESKFFTSKAVDPFTLESNGLRWMVDNVRKDFAVGTSTVTRGTRIHLDVPMHPRQPLEAVFAEFSRELEFVRSRPADKLFEYGVCFASRREAKRLVVGLEKFREAEIDFTGVANVGQGFVDEVFPVWPANHPETLLIATNMNVAVEFMVSRGIAKSR